MLQRNATDHPLDVNAIPATVQPGETVDWPDPIVGFEEVPPPTKKATAAKTSAASEKE